LHIFHAYYLYYSVRLTKTDSIITCGMHTGITHHIFDFIKKPPGSISAILSGDKIYSIYF